MTRRSFGQLLAACVGALFSWPLSRVVPETSYKCQIDAYDCFGPCGFSRGDKPTEYVIQDFTTYRFPLVRQKIPSLGLSSSTGIRD